MIKSTKSFISATKVDSALPKKKKTVAFEGGGKPNVIQRLKKARGCNCGGSAPKPGATIRQAGGTMGVTSPQPQPATNNLVAKPSEIYNTGNLSAVKRPKMTTELSQEKPKDLNALGTATKVQGVGGYNNPSTTGSKPTASMGAIQKMFKASNQAAQPQRTVAFQTGGEFVPIDEEIPRKILTHHHSR